MINYREQQVLKVVTCVSSLDNCFHQVTCFASGDHFIWTEHLFLNSVALSEYFSVVLQTNKGGQVISVVYCYSCDSRKYWEENGKSSTWQPLLLLSIFSLKLEYGTEVESRLHCVISYSFRLWCVHKNICQPLHPKNYKLSWSFYGYQIVAQK